MILIVCVCVCVCVCLSEWKGFGDVGERGRNRERVGGMERRIRLGKRL